MYVFSLSYIVQKLFDHYTPFVRYDEENHCFMIVLVLFLLLLHPSYPICEYLKLSNSYIINSSIELAKSNIITFLALA